MYATFVPVPLSTQLLHAMHSASASSSIHNKKNGNNYNNINNVAVANKHEYLKRYVQVFKFLSNCFTFHCSSCHKSVCVFVCVCAIVFRLVAACGRIEFDVVLPPKFRFPIFAFLTFAPSLCVFVRLHSSSRFGAKEYPASLTCLWFVCVCVYYVYKTQRRMDNG